MGSIEDSSDYTLVYVHVWYAKKINPSKPRIKPSHLKFINDIQKRNYSTSVKQKK
jgi:hypothetical protein